MTGAAVGGGIGGLTGDVGAPVGGGVGGVTCAVWARAAGANTESTTTAASDCRFIGSVEADTSEGVPADRRAEGAGGRRWAERPGGRRRRPVRGAGETKVGGAPGGAPATTCPSGRSEFPIAAIRSPTTKGEAFSNRKTCPP